MQARVKNIQTAMARLDAAVQDMHQGNVACRRNLMVFRSRMDAAEKVMDGMALALERTMAALEEAAEDARRAADIFRATAAGRSAD